MSGAKRILTEAEETEARIRLGAKKLSGTIHMSEPVDLGRNRIAPLLDAFIDEHPEVSADLTLNDGYANLLAKASTSLSGLVLLPTVV